MRKSGRVISPVHAFFPLEVEGFDSLAELALNMYWSWNHLADELWEQLDPELWQLTANPWVVLQTVSRDRLQRALSDPAFRKKVDDLVRAKDRETASPTWFQNEHPAAPLTSVAYFSMEFMLSEALPIYSGGLGNVAGDQLKAANDLGVPVVGIGLLYQQGYFRQVIDRNGAQLALFPYNDPGQLPITPLREANGEWLRLEIKFPGYSVWLRTWQVQVGRVKLFLLDTNDAANYPPYRGITSELYGGGLDLRLKQEVVLGIGGWRLLVELGIKPQICHLNEGHTAFAILARAQSFMEATGQPFEAALAATRAGNLFTTHTPVPAGFDRFPPWLVEQYLSGYARHTLGISVNELLALGRQNPNDPNEPFNMSYLAFRGSGAVNGVSRLHGEVSRHIFEPLFPRWPQSEVPVGYVTNGVHMPTWESAHSDDLWNESCGRDRWLGTQENLRRKIIAIPDSRLWQFRSEARAALVEYVRRRLALQLAVSGAPPADVEAAGNILDANALTLGFARRFATYKRPNLLLHDPERLIEILGNPQHPVQIIVAGKAHPEDGAGQAMIQEWTQFMRRPEAKNRTVFLSDYDMLLTRHLVQGVDVWINTPRRPFEASGTSGMKVLVNGGINLSELDGWWAEAYSAEAGWALGDGREHGYDPALGAAEAEALYDLLEKQVIPEFYSRDDKNIPSAWIARMRTSMANLTPQYSANRTVRDYAERYYLPGAAAYLERTANKGARGSEVVKWQKDLEQKWPNLYFGDVRIETRDGEHLFEVQVYLDGLDPGNVRVELYAEGSDLEETVRQEMVRVKELTGAEHGYVYSAKVSAVRPAADYTARVVPFNPGVAVPLETNLILWQR